MKMKQNCKMTHLFVALLVQATTLMAEVPQKLYGTYKGTAKVKLVQNDGKKLTNQPSKTFDVEIVKRGGDVKLVLKNFKLGNDEFSEVVLNNLDANHESTKKRWNIFAYPLGNKFTNKAGKKVELFALIYDDYSFIYEDGKIELAFEIYTQAENRYEHDFTGKRTVASGIDSVTIDKRTDDVVYDLSGRRVTNPGKGVYIINGKKVLK